VFILVDSDEYGSLDYIATHDCVHAAVNGSPRMRATPRPGIIERSLGLVEKDVDAIAA
jgi:hypothetical protein